MGTGNWRRPRSRPDYSHRALQLLTWERLTDGDLTACRWQDGVLVQGAPTRQECAARQNAPGLAWASISFGERGRRRAHALY